MSKCISIILSLICVKFCYGTDEIYIKVDKINEVFQKKVINAREEINYKELKEVLANGDIKNSRFYTSSSGLALLRDYEEKIDDFAGVLKIGFCDIKNSLSKGLRDNSQGNSDLLKNYKQKNEFLEYEIKKKNQEILGNLLNLDIQIQAMTKYM